MAAALLNSLPDMRPALHSDRGFSLNELMLTLAVAATLMAMALPVMTDVTQNAKLNASIRMVERELQSARLKSVSTNSILRVRLNCPSAGSIRTVEVLGSAADSAANRCDLTTYPYPPADQDMATRPNYDGPVNLLPNESTVSAAVFEFRPDGTVAQVVLNVPQTIPAGGVNVTVTRRSRSRTVNINGLGKVQIQ